MLELVDVRTGYGRSEVIHGASLKVPADGVADLRHVSGGRGHLVEARLHAEHVQLGELGVGQHLVEGGAHLLGVGLDALAFGLADGGLTVGPPALRGAAEGVGGDVVEPL